MPTPSYGPAAQPRARNRPAVLQERQGQTIRTPGESRRWQGSFRPNTPTGYLLAGEVGRGEHARSVRIATFECAVDEIFRTPLDDPAPATS